jgi:hypothetical protein
MIATKGTDMHKDRVTALALTNGFKLKEQPDGSMALNPYVFDFAVALLKDKDAEIAALTGDRDNALALWTVAQAERSEAMMQAADLDAEIAALRQDAELYRFARADMSADAVREAWTCGLDESLIDRNIATAMKAQAVHPTAKDGK